MDNKSAKKRSQETGSASSPGDQRKKPKSDSDAGPGTLDVAIPADASPAEMLAFAVEELGRDSDDSRAVAQKLLEEGLARLEAAAPALGGADWRAAAAAAAASRGAVVVYAALAVALAAALRLDALFERVQAGVASIPDAEKDADLWRLQGEACIKRLAARNGLDLSAAVDDDDDDDDDDDEHTDDEDGGDDDDDDDGEKEVDKEELKKARFDVETMQTARFSFIQAVEYLKKEANDQTLLKVTIAQLLRNYALAVKQSDKKSPVPIAVLTFALSLIEIPFDPSAPLIPEQDSQDLLHSTKASCLYYLARFRAAGGSDSGDERGATQDAKECIRALGMVVGKESNESNQELLGQSYVFLSTVTANDDLALAAFSRGAQILREVLSRNPSNETLKAQLAALGADADDLEQEDVADEDGNVFDLAAEIERDDSRSDEEDVEDEENEDGGEWSDEDED